MLVIYIVMVIAHKKAPELTFIGYIKAFSEAAMVGALADWFAVTALFHKPLGLNIPHTNLIEERKNDIGQKGTRNQLSSDTHTRPDVTK